jgi:hypothetical protein
MNIRSRPTLEILATPVLANIIFILVYMFDLFFHGRDTDPNDVPFLNDGVMIFLVVLGYGILSLI